MMKTLKIVRQSDGRSVNLHPWRITTTSEREENKIPFFFWVKEQNTLLLQISVQDLRRNGLCTRNYRLELSLFSKKKKLPTRITKIRFNRFNPNQNLMKNYQSGNVKPELVFCYFVRIFLDLRVKCSSYEKSINQFTSPHFHFFFVYLLNLCFFSTIYRELAQEQAQ